MFEEGVQFSLQLAHLERQKLRVHIRAFGVGRAAGKDQHDEGDDGIIREFQSREHGCQIDLWLRLPDQAWPVGVAAYSVVRRHHELKTANLCWRKCRTSLDRETLTKINPTIEITKPINPKVSAEKAALVNATTTPK